MYRYRRDFIKKGFVNCFNKIRKAIVKVQDEGYLYEKLD